MPSTRTHFSFAALTANAPVTAGVKWLDRSANSGAITHALHVAFSLPASARATNR